MGKGGMHCGTPYMYCGVGIDAKGNLDLFEYMAFTLSNLTGPWIVGGGLELHPSRP